MRLCEATPRSNRMEVRMGVLMIRCPETGRGIQTQYALAPEQFRTMPVFFGRSYCSICRAEHEWFARDAWVDEHLVESGGSHPRTPLRIKASDVIHTREVGDEIRRLSAIPEYCPIRADPQCIKGRNRKANYPEFADRRTRPAKSNP
jgi:hypothetical protein